MAAVTVYQDGFTKNQELLSAIRVWTIRVNLVKHEVRLTDSWQGFVIKYDNARVFKTQAFREHGWESKGVALNIRYVVTGPTLAGFGLNGHLRLYVNGVEFSNLPRFDDRPRIGRVTGWRWENFSRVAANPATSVQITVERTVDNRATFEKFKGSTVKTSTEFRAKFSLPETFQFKLGATDVSETTNVSVFRQATTEIKRVSATFSVPAATPLAVYGLNLTLEQDGEEVIMKTMVITPTNGPPPPPPGPDVVSQLFDTN